MPASTARAKASRAGSPFHWQSLVWVLGVAGGLLFLWDHPVVWPLRLLVVFFHELGHAVAAWTTGGEVREIHVLAEEGGCCVSAGGNRFVIFSAGYLGSLAFGISLLLVAARTRHAPAVSAVLGLGLVSAAAAFVPMDTNRFGKLFGVASGVALGLLALLPAAWPRAVLSVVGVTSCMYVLVDVKSDVLDRSVSGSDAHQLEVLTGVPAVLWGIAWLVVSGVATVLTLKWVVFRRSQRGGPGK